MQLSQHATCCIYIIIILYDMTVSCKDFEPARELLERMHPAQICMSNDSDLKPHSHLSIR